MSAHAHTGGGPPVRPRRSARWHGVLVPAGLLLAAEAGMRLSGFESESVAPPSAALLAGLRALLDGSLLLATGETLASAFLGLLLGGGIGLAAGLLLGSVKPLNQLMNVTIEALRPIPAVALIPIALLVYGFGHRMEIAVVAFAFACVWPMLVLTRAAIAGVELCLLEVARALRFGLLRRIVKIILPACVSAWKRDLVSGVIGVQLGSPCGVRPWRWTVWLNWIDPSAWASGGWKSWHDTGHTASRSSGR